ncbi:hypothetical protein [Nonomuraea sp. bgisy101]|uniref:hypothetical protein n=1 Tax=Nonomuraea sp. bgisy101 TaxID=3413784 RepID=UPI003D75908D
MRGGCVRVRAGTAHGQVGWVGTAHGQAGTVCGWVGWVGTVCGWVGWVGWVGTVCGWVGTWWLPLVACRGRGGHVSGQHRSTFE